jgi:predicted Na+-dependent transporter
MSELPLHRLLNEAKASVETETEGSSSTGSHTGDVLIAVCTNLLLFMLIFGMSATVNFRHLKRQLRNKYAILTGIGMQFIIMPLLGFLSVVLFKNNGFSPATGITLLIVTASPGGSYSNWWCSLFNADLALSVAMTALSTILSIGLLPANLMLYSYFAYGFDDEQNVMKSVDFGALFISLGIVIGAITSGLFASYKMKSNTFRRYANNFGTIAGIALVIFSGVFSSVAGGPDVKPWNQEWGFYVGVASPCIFGLLIANSISKLARLSKPERVTLSVECCYQNVGIATSAALSMFSDPKEVAQAMAVPLFYGLLEMVILGLYCLAAWKLGWTKAPANERICIVLSRSFEVDQSDYSTDDVVKTSDCEGGEDIENQRQIQVALTCTSSSVSGSYRTPRNLLIQDCASFSSGSLPVRKNTEETELGNDEFSFESALSTCSSSARRRKLFPNRSADSRPGRTNRIPGVRSMVDDGNRMDGFFPNKLIRTYSKEDDDSETHDDDLVLSPYATPPLGITSSLTPSSLAVSDLPSPRSTSSQGAQETLIRRAMIDDIDIIKDGTKLDKVKKSPLRRAASDGANKGKDGCISEKSSLTRRRRLSSNISFDRMVLPPLSPRPPRSPKISHNLDNDEVEGIEIECSSSGEMSC